MAETTISVPEGTATFDLPFPPEEEPTPEPPPESTSSPPGPTPDPPTSEPPSQPTITRSVTTDPFTTTDSSTTRPSEPTPQPPESTPQTLPTITKATSTSQPTTIDSSTTRPSDTGGTKPPSGSAEGSLSSTPPPPTNTSPTRTVTPTDTDTFTTGITISAPSNSDSINTSTTSKFNDSVTDSSDNHPGQTSSNRPDEVSETQLPGSTSGQAPMMSTGSGTSATPTGGLPDDTELHPISESGRSSRQLAVILGIIFGLVFLISILLYMLCCRRRRKKRRGVLSTAWQKMPNNSSVMEQSGGTWYNDWRMRDPSSGLVADRVEKRPLSLPRLPWTKVNASKADSYEDARLATHMLTSDSSWDRYSATPSFESTSSDAYSAAPDLSPVPTGDSSALTSSTFADSSEYESEIGTTGSLSFTSPSGRPGTSGSTAALPVTSTGHYAVDGEILDDKTPLPPVSVPQGGELLFINMPWQRTRESARPSIMEVVHSFNEGR